MNMPLRRAWFLLDRHDDPDPQPAPEPEAENDPAPDEAPEGEPDGNPDDGEPLGPKGQRAIDRMKSERAEAKREAAAAKKQAAELAKKVAEFEDRDKSDLDKATARAEKSEARAEQATKRAVLAEVKALAADTFKDVDDARVNLLDKLDSYINDDGDIDTDAIASDLEEVLVNKAHLRKKTAPDKKTPKPDPGQGPRTPAPPTDYRTASREDYDREMAKYGVRSRR